MRHPSSDNRAAQFMFASPRSAKHVRTSSCAKALARMSYTRGLASFFIVATPASNCLLNREHITADGETPSRDGTTHLVMSPLEFVWQRTVLVPQSHPPVNEHVLIGASALERAVRLPGRTPASAHRFLHERADPCFFGGGQLLQREGDRPHGAFALLLKPSVMYLSLNICPPRKKQTTMPSLAYPGIPYQTFGERAGALALMMAWSRSPMARYGSGIAAIFASTALSPSALSARGPGRAAAFFAAFLVVLLADFCVPFAWASLPGACFSDISVSFLVAFRRLTSKPTRARTRCSNNARCFSR